MNTSTLITQIAALGLMTTLADGASILRFTGSGNWTKIAGVGGSNGWTVLPGAGDEARINYSNNTVTVDSNVGTTGSVKLGVDQNGNLIIASGGKLGTTGDFRVGNNNKTANNSNLTVEDGGTLNIGGIFWTSTSGAIGNISLESGSVVTVGSHLWWGINDTSVISIAGSLTQTAGNLGLGTSNANSASGGTATVSILNGGVLALHSMSAEKSIQAGSVIDLSGSGRLTVKGNSVNAFNDYITANKITGNGLTGAANLNVIYDSGLNLTTVTAVPEPSPTMLIGLAGIALVMIRRRA